MMNAPALTFPLPTGVYDLPAEVYHADRMCAVPTLSSTLARLLLTRSPRHAWHASPRLNPDHEPAEKRAFDIGRAVHRAVLGKGGDYVAYPDHVLAKNGAASTAEAKEWASEMRARHLTPLKTEEVHAINDMAGEVMGRLAGMGLAFPPARSELTAIAEIDGVLCRAMFDHVPEDPRQPIWDLKTTMDANPDAIQRTVMAYGYDTQAAHYTDVWKATTGETRSFNFLFVEKEAPHEICIVRLDYDAMEMGRKRIARAREMWAHCLRSEVWPGYPAQIVQMSLPEWYQARWLEREITEANIKADTGADILALSYQWQAPFNHGENPWA